MLPHAIGIVKGPYSQLIQHSKFGEDVEISKVVGFLLGAVGVRLAFGLVFVLCAYRLIPVVQAGRVLATTLSSGRDKYIREITTRGDELQ